MALPAAVAAINYATGFTPQGTGNPTSPLYNVNPMNPAAPTAAPTPAAGGYNQAAIDAINAQTAQYAQQNKLLAQQVANAPKVLPYDYVGAQNTARSQAEGAVNPLYLKTFNTYLNNAKINQQRQQTDTQTANQLLQESLQNTLQGNDITGQRTTQDVGTNIAGINQQAQNFQQDTGQAFDANRLAQARAGGTAGGGLGAQAQNLQTAQANTQENRQQQSFDLQKQQQDLFKTRTFEDLARSGALATKGEAQGETQNKLNLARYIQDYGVNENNVNDQSGFGRNVVDYQNQLEQQRLGDLYSKQQQIYGNNFNQYLGTLKGQNAATLQLMKSLYGA